MCHIELSRAADLIVVAPATADLMGKMAAGLAGDLATTLLLATDKRVLIAPSMNVRMWDHPATRRNLARLLADGILVVGPNEGPMACGEFGPGRMAEVPEIVAAIGAALGDGPLKGAMCWSHPARPMNPSTRCAISPTDPRGRKAAPWPPRCAIWALASASSPARPLCPRPPGWR